MIDQAQVEHVAKLARLQLNDQEKVAFGEQLNNILTYVSQLSELDSQLENVEPTTRAIDKENITRPDELNLDKDLEALLNCAPDREDTFFRVPQIMG